MTERAWAEAGQADYSLAEFVDSSGRGEGLNVARVPLTPSAPEAWVVSITVGSLGNPVLWVFASTPDGTRADHLLAQFGFEGSGPFDTAFIRFKGTPYAVLRFRGEKGSSLDVYALDPAKALCSVRPR